jgi:hypothetical protein
MAVLRRPLLGEDAPSACEGFVFAGNDVRWQTAWFEANAFADTKHRERVSASSFEQFQF